MQIPPGDPTSGSVGPDSGGSTRRQYLAGFVATATGLVAGRGVRSGGSRGDEAGLDPFEHRWGRSVENPARPTFDDAGLYLGAKYGFAGVDRSVGVYALAPDGSQRWRASTRDGTSGAGMAPTPGRTPEGRHERRGERFRSLGVRPEEVGELVAQMWQRKVSDPATGFRRL